MEDFRTRKPDYHNQAAGRQRAPGKEPYHPRLPGLGPSHSLGNSLVCVDLCALSLSWNCLFSAGRLAWAVCNPFLLAGHPLRHIYYMQHAAVIVPTLPYWALFWQIILLFCKHGVSPSCQHVDIRPPLCYHDLQWQMVRCSANKFHFCCLTVSLPTYLCSNPWLP